MAVSIRFRFNPHKAIEVIVWLASRKPGITFHTLLKLLFFADKRHLNRYGRPIVGDDYVVMQYGPVASTTYDILKDEALAKELVHGERPFRVQGRFQVYVDQEVDYQALSESDIKALDWAMTNYGQLTFDELSELTHKDPAYVNAEGHLIRYEDFLEDSDGREERISELRESARRMVL